MTIVPSIWMCFCLHSLLNYVSKPLCLACFGWMVGVALSRKCRPIGLSWPSLCFCRVWGTIRVATSLQPQPKSNSIKTINSKYIYTPQRGETALLSKTLSFWGMWVGACAFAKYPFFSLTPISTQSHSLNGKRKLKWRSQLRGLQATTTANQSPSHFAKSVGICGNRDPPHILFFFTFH